MDRGTNYYTYFSRKPSFILELLDSFIHHGPNGEHICQVFNVMVPSVSDTIHIPALRSPKIGRLISLGLYPLPIVKWILRDTLRGLRQMHSAGLVHADLHLRNILFTPNFIQRYSVKVLTNVHNKGYILNQKDPGDIERYPKYLYPPNPLYSFTTIWIDVSPRVMLADLGFGKKDPRSRHPPIRLLTWISAFQVDRPCDARSGVPAFLRVPEEVLCRPLGTGIDIWAFGCLIYELVASRQLFCVEQLEGGSLDEMTNDDHLMQMNEILGFMPPSLTSQWRRASSYYDKEGCLRVGTGPRPLNADGFNYDQSSRSNGDESEFSDSIESCLESGDSGDNGREAPLARSRPFDSLEESFQNIKRDDIEEDEKREVIRLIRKCLQYDPANRPSASMLLSEEPWFHSADECNID